MIFGFLCLDCDNGDGKMALWLLLVDFFVLTIDGCDGYLWVKLNPMLLLLLFFLFCLFCFDVVARKCTCLGLFMMIKKKSIILGLLFHYECRL